MRHPLLPIADAHLPVANATLSRQTAGWYGDRLARSAVFNLELDVILCLLLVRLSVRRTASKWTRVSNGLR